MSQVSWYDKDGLAIAGKGHELKDMQFDVGECSDLIRSDSF